MAKQTYSQEEVDNNSSLQHFDLALKALTVALCDRRPEDRGPLLTSFVGSLTAPMPDDQWQRTMHAAKIPCGVEDCNCHVLSGALVDAIDAIRDDCHETWREDEKERKHEA